MEIACRLVPVATINQVIPIRDLVVHRAAGRRAGDTIGAVAIRHAAIHAARGLLADFLFGEREHELVPMLHAFGDRLIVAVLALDFQKPGDLTHAYSAACIVAAFSFAISASARRYSTGITLRKSGR